AAAPSPGRSRCMSPFPNSGRTCFWRRSSPRKDAHRGWRSRSGRRSTRHDVGRVLLYRPALRSRVRPAFAPPALRRSAGAFGVCGKDPAYNVGVTYDQVDVDDDRARALRLAVGRAGAPAGRRGEVGDAHTRRVQPAHGFGEPPAVTITD